MTAIRTTDFFLEVAKGEVAGQEIRIVNMHNPSVGQTFEDFWFAGGLLSYPTTGETWQIRSTDAQDNPSGTGAGFVRVNSLGVGYNQQTEIATMNGTTPVILTNSNFRSGISQIAAPIGSNEKNVGDIIIETTGGVRRQTIAANKGLSHDGFFTVPIGLALFGIQLVSCPSKGQSGNIQIGYRLAGVDEPFIFGPPIPFYEGIIVMPVKSPFGVPEKTDIRFQISSDNPDAFLTQQADIILISNSQLQNPPVTIEAR